MPWPLMHGALLCGAHHAKACHVMAHTYMAASYVPDSTPIFEESVPLLFLTSVTAPDAKMY